MLIQNKINVVVKQQKDLDVATAWPSTVIQKHLRLILHKRNVRRSLDSIQMMKVPDSTLWESVSNEEWCKKTLHEEAGVCFPVGLKS